jgi:F420-non-reducing hydrogenase iron-sulfur subunit
MLEDFGIEEERFRIEWVSASEGPRFAEVMMNFTKEIQELGPSPYKM